MFLDCLEMIFSSLESVVKALDVDIFTVGTIGVSFWELILGLLVIGIIFGFFLTPRAGSGIQAFSNENKKANAEHFRKEKLKAIERQKSYERKSKK